MGKMRGATTAVSAGVFGSIAAIMTLGVGLASAIHPEAATEIGWSEWVGLVLSFSTVFLGAICLHVRCVSAKHP